MKARVVAVDDDLDTLKLFSLALSEEGYEVAGCLTAADAIACLQDAAPALIILDAHLGGLGSGWHVLAQLTADPMWRTIPVIICSAARREVEAQRLALEQDGHHILHKPFDLDTLLSLVERLTVRKSNRDDGAQDRARVAGASLNSGHARQQVAGLAVRRALVTQGVDLS